MNCLNSIVDSEMGNPGIVPLLTFDPYAIMYQQHPMFFNGWPTLNYFTIGSNIRQGPQVGSSITYDRFPNAKTVFPLGIL